MEAVNLLPAYARPGHRWATAGKDMSAQRVARAGGAVACVAVVALGLGYIHERSAVNDNRATLDEVQARVTALEAQAAPLRTAQSAAAARMAAAGTISASRIAWENVLRDLSRVLPEQVYLLTLQAQSPAALAGAASATAVAVAPSAFTATGSASSQVRVAQVLDRLALLPWLSNVSLVSLTRGTGTPGSSAASGAAASSGSLGAGDQFSISAVFNGAGGAK